MTNLKIFMACCSFKESLTLKVCWLNSISKYVGAPTAQDCGNALRLHIHSQV